MGTPWKTPRSNRLGCERWFGGIFCTRTAMLCMRLRNSCGSESSESLTTLTKYSRFILHPLKQRKSRSLRVAVVAFFVIVVFFGIVILVLFFFFVRFMSKQ